MHQAINYILKKHTHTHTHTNGLQTVTS